MTCLNELSYVRIDPRGAELLFQIITEREERASIAIAIATNLPFSERGAVFPDPRLVAAIVDRFTFDAHILETGTQSYRPRTSKKPAAAPTDLERGQHSRRQVGPENLTKPKAASRHALRHC